MITCHWVVGPYVGDAALSDRDVFGIAISERRVIVTENVIDFVPLHAEALATSASHFGVVLTSPRTFPRTRRVIGRLVRALDRLLAEHAADDALRDQT
jgi:hypothetical protein